jgi:hypothetical protein
MEARGGTLPELGRDLNRLLKNARLLRFPHPSPFNVQASTSHGSGFRGPCIQTFLNSLNQRLFQQAAEGVISEWRRCAAHRRKEWRKDHET